MPNCIEKPLKINVLLVVIQVIWHIVHIAIGDIFFWKKNCIWFDNENILARHSLN